MVSIYPVAPLMRRSKLANDCDLGLNFSVWSSNTRRAECNRHPAPGGERLRSTTDIVATWGSHDAPMGGVKRSGLGRRHGQEGLLKFTEPQTVAVQRVIPAYAPTLGLSYETYRKLIERLIVMFRHLPFYK